MCGILAQINRNNLVDKNQFEKMRDTLTHRGPDDKGSYTSEDQKTALGHRRLSVIDLSKHGRQPMSNEDKTIWLSYNGEIYNFKDLREILEAKSHLFFSQTDSEVIIHAYEEWGKDCLSKLWGMFAFVIWDEKKQILFGARDRLGVKPLHYYIDQEKLICASEIKAIIENENVPKNLDISALCDYLTYRYIPAPKTIWKNIHKLRPAHAFIFDKKGFRIWRYWQLEPKDDLILTDEAQELLYELFRDAVKRRLISDVPLGLFLSGGLDSTAIAWVMNQLNQEVKSFTIGFKNYDKDETKDAELVSNYLKTNHFVEYLSEKELNSIKDLLWFFDEPFGASSMIPTYLVSKVARKNVTVALSGDGGDEAFAGYLWYDKLINVTKRGKWKDWFLLTRDEENSVVDKLAKQYRRITTPRFNRYEIHRLFNTSTKNIEEDELWFFKEAINKEIDGIKQLQWLDIHTFLPEEVLTKVDRATMANSLEVRSPFLDHRIFEWIFSLSEKVYFNGEKKHLIKNLLKKEIPNEVIEKPKQGFSAPVNKYWNDQIINKYLLNSEVVKDNIFNVSFIKTLIKERDASSTYSKRWLLFIFEIWYRRWVKNKN